jgi:hypothetical protein
MYKKITPVFIVESIEPVLPLWSALGFARTAEVPDGDRLGFVILQKDDVEVMYQTFASVKGDEPRSLDGKRAIGASGVFIVVDKLDDVARLVPADADVIERRRETFYGAIEMILRDAAGNVIVLAEMKA